MILDEQTEQDSTVSLSARRAWIEMISIIVLIIGHI